MLQCTSRFSVAQGPPILPKEKRKPQQKRLLFIIFLKGIATNTLYSALLLLMMTNLSENKFSQIGVGLAG